MKINVLIFRSKVDDRSLVGVVFQSIVDSNSYHCTRYPHWCHNRCMEIADLLWFIVNIYVLGSLEPPENSQTY